MILERYLSFCREVRCLKEKTIKEYFYILRIIGQHLDYLKPGDQSSIERSILQAKESGAVKWSQLYTAKVSIVVMGFFKRLSAENLIPFNPYIVNRFKKPRPKEPDYLTQKEFDFVIKNPLLTHQSQSFLRLAWDTGARKSELLSLDQKDIDLKEDVIQINHSKGDYGNRVVPFTKVTHNYLETQISWLSENGIKGFLFVDEHWNRFGESSCNKMMVEIGNMRTPKREPFRFHLHALRHSLGMRLLDAGANESYVQKILGHTNGNQTLHYIHYTKGRSRELYDQLVG